MALDGYCGQVTLCNTESSFGIGANISRDKPSISLCMVAYTQARLTRYLLEQKSKEVEAANTAYLVNIRIVQFQSKTHHGHVNNLKASEVCNAWEGYEG